MNTHAFSGRFTQVKRAYRTHKKPLLRMILLYRMAVCFILLVLVIVTRQHQPLSFPLSILCLMTVVGFFDPGWLLRKRALPVANLNNEEVLQLAVHFEEAAMHPWGSVDAALLYVLTADPRFKHNLLNPTPNRLVRYGLWIMAAFAISLMVIGLVNSNMVLSQSGVVVILLMIVVTYYVRSL